jgi:hypothetical protein|nr:MAG TPA: Large Terminase [Caudoviricetes sp.]
MTQQEKQALRQWEEFHKSFARDALIDHNLTAGQIDKLRKELEADPVRWCKYLFPGYAKYEFAPFHIKAIKRLTQNDEWYEVLSWSRELAKSTITMMVMLYLALTKRKRFFVMTSSSKDSARDYLTPYRINLEMNPRLKQLYGDQINIGSWEAHDFTARCGARFLALGAGQSPRGKKNESIRPDVIIADDFDTDEDCRNPETIKKKWEWYNQALYPTRSISEPTLIVWCGNIIAKDCCVVRAGALADHWDVINIRDKHGKSTWPEKNTEEFIDRTLKPIPRSSQQKEYFNNPLSEGSVFKNLAFGKIPPLNRFKYLIAYGDPAYSDRKTKQGSFKALWLIGKLGDKYYVIKGYLARETNANFIGWYFDLKKWVGGKTEVYFYVENNKLQDPFYEQVFKPLIREEINRRGEEIYIRPDERKKTDKAVRIENNLEPLDRLGQLVFNEDERDNPHMVELINQGTLFDMHLPYPADGLDAVEGGISLIKSKSAELDPPAVIRYDELNKNNPYRI